MRLQRDEGGGCAARSTAALWRRAPRFGLRLTVACLALACPAAAQSPVAVGARQLVMPFENVTTQPRVYWLGEGSAVLLTDDLVALGAPAITRDDRLRALDRLGVPSAAGLSHATVIRVGEVLGAAQVVVGSFSLQGETLTVRARAIRLDTGRLFPEVVESGGLNEIFAVYARVARRLLPDSRVSAEQMEGGHPPLPAFEQYIKGVLAGNLVARIGFLTEALRQAPDFQRSRLALWQARMDQGEYQQALSLVSAVPATHPLSRQARFLATISRLSLAQYQSAFDTLTELQREQPDAAVLNNLGVTQLRRPAGGSGNASATYFADAARADANDPDLFFNLGYAHWQSGDAQSATTALREAVRRNPADDAAHYVLGVALQAAGSGTEAAREKELAKRLSSEYADWEARQPGVNSAPRGLERLKLALSASSALRVDEVIVSAGQRDQRELAAFHLESGRRLLTAERDADAISELRRAVYLAPYQSEAHLLLGRAYLRLARLPEAIDAFKISIWSADTVAARLALVEAYIQAQNGAAALAELNIVTAREPANADAARLRARLPVN